MAQPAGAIINLPSGTASDVVFAPDGRTLYVSSGGKITAYDVASGAVSATWNVGTQLGGLDVSADGHSLVATELTTGPVISGTNNARDVYVHRLNLDTGVTTDFGLRVQGQDNYFVDASFLSDGKVLLTQNFLGSGWLPLTTLDMTTGVFSRSAQSYAQDGTLTATPDKTHVAFMPSNISDAPVFIYTAGVGITASHQNYADGVMGYNRSVQAISASGHLIAQGAGLNIYDGNLHYQLSLSSRVPFTNVTGLAFSPDESHLYVLDGTAKTIFVLKTADWSIEGGYSVGSTSADTGRSYGDTLRVSDDGHYLSVIGSTGVQIIDLTHAVNEIGTNGDDVLTGDGGANYLYGFDGNDVLDGAGNPITLEGDVMYGGRGNDVYYVDSPNDRVIEGNGADGYDTVYSTINFSAPGDIEKIVLTGTAQYAQGARTLVGNDVANGLTGTLEDDTLIGNGGDDNLDGRAGNDAMAGGEGNDVYSLDSLGDTVTELADQGIDTVYVNFDYTLPENVENLKLTVYGGVNGTGNASNNLIVGNDLANRLEGLDGDDVITAGPLINGLAVGHDLGPAKDTLIGGNGNDTIWAGAGDDADGGAGFDVLNIAFDFAPFEVVVDTKNLLTKGTLSFVPGRYANFEAIGSLRGTVFADTITLASAALPQTVDASRGNDVIRVGLTDVSVSGGEGDDRLIVLAEDPGNLVGPVHISFDGGSGSDTIDLTAMTTAGATISLDPSAPANSSGDAHAILNIFSVENAIGSTGKDTIVGSGFSNRLGGGLGSDTLTGGGGNDIFLDTAAGLDGDTITDFGVGDVIRIDGATLAGFAFALNGSTLTYTGGSLTLPGLPSGFHFVAMSTMIVGGVELTLRADAPPLFNNTLTGDYNGDGRDDLLWRSDAGQLSNWLGKTNGGFVGNDANAFAMVDPSWKVVGAGDFDGDGRDDIVWRNSNTGQVSDWLGKVNGGFVGNDADAFALVDVSWKIVGTGDFNGDGKDDLLWRNENTGQLSDWLGNASGNGGFSGNDANAFTQVGTDWKIVGFADFNGDGKDDLLWRNASTGALSDWLGNASGNGGFTGNDAKAFAMVDKAWHVIGTGDFNGDGREDILWRSDTGQLSNWLGKPDGGFAGNDANAFRQVGLDWQVAGVGDYDGDKRDDILWRNTTTGALSDWLGQANGGFAGNDGNALVTGVSLTWHNPVFDSFAV